MDHQVYNCFMLKAWQREMLATLIFLSWLFCCRTSSLLLAPRPPLTGASERVSRRTKSVRNSLERVSGAAGRARETLGDFVAKGPEDSCKGRAGSLGLSLFEDFSLSVWEFMQILTTSLEKKKPEYWLISVGFFSKERSSEFA